MDPAFQPINGISLERYAELGAAIEPAQGNAQKENEIIQAEGVSLPDWEAAKTGWTARMQDMSLMGKVATAYMPLYQAALAKKSGGAARLSYDDFVHVSAAIKVVGFEAAIQACGLSQGDWTQAAGDWNQQMGQNMHQFANHPNALAQAEAQLRAPGGTPRRVNVTRAEGQGMQASAAQVAAAQGQGNVYAAQQGVQAPAGAMPGPFGDAMAAAMANPAMQQQMQANQAIAQNPLGFGLGQAANALTGGIIAGSRVNIAWSDGNKYPAQVLQCSPGQMLVKFDNGSQQWVPENCVSKA